jgi:hypothetical protein
MPSAIDDAINSIRAALARAYLNSYPLSLIAQDSGLDALIVEARPLTPPTRDQVMEAIGALYDNNNTELLIAVAGILNIPLQRNEDPPDHDEIIAYVRNIDDRDKADAKAKAEAKERADMDAAIKIAEEADALEAKEAGDDSNWATVSSKIKHVVAPHSRRQAQKQRNIDPRILTRAVLDEMERRGEEPDLPADRRDASVTQAAIVFGFRFNHDGTKLRRLAFSSSYSSRVRVNDDYETRIVADDETDLRGGKPLGWTVEETDRGECLVSRQWDSKADRYWHELDPATGAFTIHYYVKDNGSWAEIPRKTFIKKFDVLHGVDKRLIERDGEFEELEDIEPLI